VEDLEQRIARLRHGDHLCQLYHSRAEQRGLLVPFVKAGLAAGERCLLLAGRADARRCERALAAAGVPLHAESERGGWVVAGGRAGTAAKDRFDPGAAVDLLRQCEQQALDDGFAGLRVAVDMGWLLGHGGAGGPPLDEVDTERLLAYEAPLTRFVEHSKTVLLCQYDLTAFPARTQSDALRTHPLAVIGEHLCANFYYEPPEMVLGHEPPEERVAWMMAQLERACAIERKVDELKDRLAEHRAALARADRRREEFLAMLAHELRNPLGTISNALEVLRLKGAGDATWQRALDAADRQVRHQARLVDDLLEVQRIGHGEVELRCERLELGELVQTTVDRQLAALEAMGVSVSLELAAERLSVRGDRRRLTQALENLLRNAVKFTPAGGRVTVRLARTPGGRRAAISVSDTGVGIGAELLPHVFEAFTQADHSLERTKGGLGVGLAVVKGLVELHGGEVEARSAGAGRGAQFTILLPIAAAAEEAGTRASGRRVLVVEDNPDAAETMRDFLVLSGHEVELAHSGTEGVAAARQFHPEVVLCDLGLPEMDGFAVATALRRDPATRGVRLIAVTGYGRDEDRRRSKEAGFDLHLTKPVDPAQLARLLQ
jgi:signal transduction histidine kinase/CheY-like chemotaxis protein